MLPIYQESIDTEKWGANLLLSKSSYIQWEGYNFAMQKPIIVSSIVLHFLQAFIILNFLSVDFMTTIFPILWKDKPEAKYDCITCSQSYS